VKRVYNDHSAGAALSAATVLPFKQSVTASNKPAKTTTPQLIGSIDLAQMRQPEQPINLRIFSKDFNTNLRLPIQIEPDLSRMDLYQFGQELQLHCDNQGTKSETNTTLEFKDGEVEIPYYRLEKLGTFFSEDVKLDDDSSSTPERIPLKQFSALTFSLCYNLTEACEKGPKSPPYQQALNQLSLEDTFACMEMASFLGQDSVLELCQMRLYLLLDKEAASTDTDQYIADLLRLTQFKGSLWENTHKTEVGRERIVPGAFTQLLSMAFFETPLGQLNTQDFNALMSPGNPQKKRTIDLLAKALTAETPLPIKALKQQGILPKTPRSPLYIEDELLRAMDCNASDAIKALFYHPKKSRLISRLAERAFLDQEGVRNICCVALAKALNPVSSTPHIEAAKTFIESTDLHAGPTVLDDTLNSFAGVELVMHLLEHGSSEAVKFILNRAPDLIRHHPEEDFIAQAVRYGKDDLIDCFMEHGDDIKSSTALTEAANRGDVALSKQLLKLGAPYEDENDELFDQTHEPLIAATFRGNLDVMSLLIDEGAQVNRAQIFAERRILPVSIAIENNRADSLRLLIEKDADTNVIEETGRGIRMNMLLKALQDARKGKVAYQMVKLLTDHNPQLLQGISAQRASHYLCHAAQKRWHAVLGLLSQSTDFCSDQTKKTKPQLYGQTPYEYYRNSGQFDEAILKTLKPKSERNPFKRFMPKSH